MDSLQLDTQQVLRNEFFRSELLDGAVFIESPIFDRMAAERFGRED